MADGLVLTWEEAKALEDALGDLWAEDHADGELSTVEASAFEKVLDYSITLSGEQMARLMLARVRKAEGDVT